MNSVLEYKGYWAKVEFDADSMILHGKIEGINDLVTFESPSADEIEIEFRSAVDDYLSLCAEVGKEPDKAYKGTFNVRIEPELHKQLAIRAMKDGVTLNAAVESAIRDSLNPSPASAETLKMLFQQFMPDIRPENTSPYGKNNVINFNIWKQEGKVAK